MVHAVTRFTGSNDFCFVILGLRSQSLAPPQALCCRSLRELCSCAPGLMLSLASRALLLRPFSPAAPARAVLSYLAKNGLLSAHEAANSFSVLLCGALGGELCALSQRAN